MNDRDWLLTRGARAAKEGVASRMGTGVEDGRAAMDAGRPWSVVVRVRSVADEAGWGDGPGVTVCGAA
jgi:hypothetical protein